MKVTEKLKSDFARALPKLEERTRIIISMKFGINREAKQNKEIAQELHISVARVSQIISAAYKNVENDSIPGEAKVIMKCITVIDDMKFDDHYHFATVEACQKKMRELLAEAKKR